MAIWLNYTHIELWEGRRLLPNYLFLLDNEFQPVNLQSPESKARLWEFVMSGKLRSTLEDPSHLEEFDAPLIWEILIASYPYEVDLKYLQSSVQNDPVRNQRIMWLFEQFFAIDYNKVLDSYCLECDREQRYTTSLATQECYYASQSEATTLFISYIVSLLRSQGFSPEAEAYEKYANTKLHISFEEWISWVTSEIGDKVIINVGNMTYATLFHELAHFTNRFFRFHYYQNYEVCFDNYTKTNEGFADFVAYHLHHQIIGGDIGAI